MKSINPNQFKEKEGLNTVATIVNRMGCTWRPTPNDDYGIDGEIEINKDGAPTGKIMKVQIKSGSSYVKNLTTTKFDFYADEDDVEYWIGSNIPVILIIVDRSHNIRHWINIKDYASKNQRFANPPHKVTFSIKGNYFGVKSFFDICKIVLTEQEFVNVTKNKILEEIYSNLLPVTNLPSKVYGISTTLNLKQIKESLSGKYIPKFYLAENKIWTFSNLFDKDNVFREIADPNTVTAVNVQEWLLDDNKRNWYIALLRKTLNSHCGHLGLLLDPKKKRFYFPPNPDMTGRIIEYDAFKRSGKRKVAYPYKDKNGIVQFWVHHAVTLDIVSFGGKWFVKVSPGYVFTVDGVTYFASDKVGKLATRRKAREWNNIMLNHLIFWREMLSDNRAAINVNCYGQIFTIAKSYESGIANFGIMKDRKSLREMHSFDDADLDLDIQTEGE